MTNFPGGITSMGVPILNSLGIGNVYHVVKSTESFYGDFSRNRKAVYDDGSQSLHTDIQSALDATVEARNDYVVVYPSDSDYDLTLALTLSKKSVHLVCPAGFGYDIGSNNSARIEQTVTGKVIFELSDTAIEIAGFYLKEYYGGSETFGHITMAATSYAPNIHHNSFMLRWMATCAGAIVASGDAGAWGKIERNWFVSQSGGARTCAAVVSIAAAATCAQVNHNQFTIGDTQIATVCIKNSAVKGNTNFNIFSESGGDGVASGGTITKAISINLNGTAIGNIGAVGSGQMLTGGTTLHSYSENYGGYIANTGTTNGSVEA